MMRHFERLGFTCHRYRILSVSIIISMLWLMPHADAAVYEDLYEVEIPVIDQTASTRRAAFDKGLSQVLVRVTGDRNIFSLIKLPRSSSYVKQFLYRETRTAPEPPAAENAVSPPAQQDIPTQSLWVQYNETKVTDFVRSNALPLWGKHRIESVVWIAVNDGVNRYVLKSSDVSALKTITENAATRRALPVVWPEIDPQEQAIRFADVWAGFTQPLKDVSGINNADSPVIIGRLLWEGEQWKSEWSLLLENNNIDWAIEHSDYQKVIAESIDTAADFMGQQFALFDTGDINSFHAIAIVIKDIKTVAALERVKKYLSSMPLVQSFQLDRIDGERAFFNVSLRSNAEDFISFTETDATLTFLPEKKEKKSGLKPLLQNEARRVQARSADYKFKLQP